MFDWGLLFSVGSFALLSILAVMRWIGTREHADSDLADKLNEHKKRCEKEFERVDREITQIRTRAHELADAQQNDRVDIAILKTRVGGSK